MSVYREGEPPLLKLLDVALERAPRRVVWTALRLGGPVLVHEHDRPVAQVGRHPPQHVIDAAVEAGSWSPCAKSKRGVAIYRTILTMQDPVGQVVSIGHNAQPRGFGCDGSDECRTNCGKLCEHAEASALRRTREPVVFNELDMLHAKVVDGALVPSGPPSCWQCSKAILADRRIGGVWLFHEDGWRRYTAVEFHRLTLETCELAGAGPW